MKVQQTKSDPMPRGKNEIQAYDGSERSVDYATYYIEMLICKKGKAVVTIGR